MVRDHQCRNDLGNRDALHGDVYRVESLDEVLDLALGELVEEAGVALVEWGELAASLFGRDVMTIEFEIDDQRGPVVWTLTARSRRARRRANWIGGRAVNIVAIETATPGLLPSGFAPPRGGESTRVVDDGPPAHRDADPGPWERCSTRPGSRRATSTAWSSTAARDSSPDCGWASPPPSPFAQALGCEHGRRHVARDSWPTAPSKPGCAARW